MIEYKTADDKGDPATATASAREIVGSDEAVAMVGSASLIECEINQASTTRRRASCSIPGVGVDTGCFDSEAHLAGEHRSVQRHDADADVRLRGAGARGHLHPARDRRLDPPDLPGGDRHAGPRRTGAEPLYIDDTVPYGASDYTPYLVKAREEGCKALAINGVEPDAVAQVKAANAQGWDDVTFLFLTSVYSENFAAAIDDAAAGHLRAGGVLPRSPRRTRSTPIGAR